MIESQDGVNVSNNLLCKSFSLLSIMISYVETECAKCTGCGILITAQSITNQKEIPENRTERYYCSHLALAMEIRALSDFFL